MRAGNRVNALDFAFGPSREIVIAGREGAGDTAEMLRLIRSRFMPNNAVLFRSAGEEKPAIVRIARLTEAQRSIRDHATADVCTNFVCKEPTTDVVELEKLLNAP